jgi:hypothetical protein
MTAPRARRSARTFAVLASMYGSLVLHTAADAQAAWLPFAGEARLSVAYQVLEFDGHFDEAGGEHRVAASRTHFGIAQVEFGITDRLAVTGRVPYIASRFTGEHHEPIMVLIGERYEELRRANPEFAALSSLDTGDYYATVQDLGFTLRYNVLDRGLTVTPVVGLTVPSHHYRTVGEAAAGQDLMALHTGVNVGRLLDPVLPNAYAHARYTYSFVQRLHDIPLDRSSAELEVGYLLTPLISVRALGNWMKTHGGIGFWEAYEDLVVFLSHDRMLATRFWQVGGGVTASLTDSIDLDGAFLKAVSGADSHTGYGVNIGLTWRFLEARPAPGPVQARKVGR